MAGRTIKIARPTYVPKEVHSIWHGAAVRCASAGKLLRNGNVDYQAITVEYKKLLETYRRLAASNGRIALDERVPEIVDRYFADAGHHDEESVIQSIMHSYDVSQTQAEKLYDQAHDAAHGMDEPTVEMEEPDEEGYTALAPRGAARRRRK